MAIKPLYKICVYLCPSVVKKIRHEIYKNI